MNFIKSLFSKKTAPTDPEYTFTPGFSEQVKHAISLLSKQEGSISDEEVLQLFANHKIAPGEAIEIVLFLPIAFIRHWLPDLNWIDSYIEVVNENEFIERKYSETPSFQIIWEVTGAYFQHSPDSATIVKIGGRSSEFDAINQALHDGGKLEDIQLSETLIVR